MTMTENTWYDDCTPDDPGFQERMDYLKEHNHE